MGGIFVTILVLTLVALVAALTHKLLKNTSSRSSYQISEGKSGEKGGVVNKGFDTEGNPKEKDGSGEKKEKWMENYVPFTSEKEVNLNKEVGNKDVTDAQDGGEGAKW